MRFLKSDSGYALVLTLLFMPVFVGMSLLVIDISRGNNAHSDLQAAADALALAGARELDGGVTSIDRAIVAMSNVSNTVSFLGRTDEAAATALTFSDTDRGAFTVVFLSALPADDDTPLTQAFLTANAVDPDEDEQGDARFVYVRAQSRDLSPFFGLFFDGVTQVTDVPVAAQAVATFRSSACDVTPLFICNPFEGEFGPDSLQTAFADGRLHGRGIRLIPQGGNMAVPGNFGFLRFEGGSNPSELRDAFATGVNPTCYEAGTVLTGPGTQAGVRTGLNVRFDLFVGSMQSNRNDPDFAPAPNVRKGYVEGPGGWCRAIPTPDPSYTRAFPLVFPPTDEGEIPGAQITASGDWGLAAYWAVNHPGTTAPPDTISSFSGRPPSRYDVYRYEIEAPTYPFNPTSDLSFGDGGNDLGLSESGRPQCNTQPVDLTREGDRRVIFAAIVDCEGAVFSGGGPTELTVNSFASIFLVNPMAAGANVEDNNSLDVEVVDITGAGGNGTLDTFVRDEANLVR